MSVHDFTVKARGGEEVPMSDYKGDVLLIVNTASKCGFTPQFTGLEQLWEKYRDEGLTVIGFPCNQFGNQDPGSDEEIAEFCQVNYGVSFPIMAKVDVNGADADPLFEHLTSETGGLLGKRIKWNFTKFLVNREGEVIKRFGSRVDPADIAPEIEKALAN